MSALRPECNPSSGAALSNRYALRLILGAVCRRRSLAHGALDVGSKHCALGCFWEDHPDVTLYTSLVDEVATFNDLTPRATPKKRWKRMVTWLRRRMEE